MHQKFDKHLLVKVFIDKAPEASYSHFLNNWFRRLIKEIDMKILVEPNSVWCDDEGNEGLSGQAMITTSHSSIHYWEEPEPYFQFDLYSCKDYDQGIVFELLKELGAKEIFFMTVDRTERFLKVIDEGQINYD